jgi:hypothetical protein
MYWLSKLLPQLLLPLGLALVLLFAAVLSGRRWPALAALLLLLIASLPLSAELLWRWLERPWQHRPAAAPSWCSAAAAMLPPV